MPNLLSFLHIIGTTVPWLVGWQEDRLPFAMHHTMIRKFPIRGSAVGHFKRQDGGKQHGH